MKERTSIKVDKEIFEQIQKFVDLSDLNYNSKADFLKKAAMAKIREEQNKLAAEEDNRAVYIELRKLNEDNKKLRGEFKEAKNGISKTSSRLF